jgi:hypothetical protein
MKLSSASLICALMVFVPAARAAPSAPAILPMSSYKTSMYSAGTGVAIALPLIATGITIYKHDRAGAAELLVGTLLSVGTVYALNNAIREVRPDGSSSHAFPAETTALAASSSSFLLDRYGFQYGLPAFAASGFVSFSLTQAKKARWYDTLASSVIATGYGFAVTRRLKSRYNITTHLSATTGGAYASLSYAW